MSFSWATKISSEKFNEVMLEKPCKRWPKKPVIKRRIFMIYGVGYEIWCKLNLIEVKLIFYVAVKSNVSSPFLTFHSARDLFLTLDGWLHE